MTVIEMGNDAIIIDTGIMFPTNDMFGVDYIIPDFTYLTEREDLKLHGILYTHGHEAHTGAVNHVVEAFPNTPIYATPLTAGLLTVKLEEAQLMGATTIHKFEAGDILSVGPFTIESFHVCHSIPGCVGFAVNTPYGLIVHTGDYKFDNTPVDGIKPDYAKLASFSDRGVILLMGDSTNATEPGWTPSETIIDEGFDRVFAEAEGRIIVATFASLISRIQQVTDAAQRYGRKLAIAGYSMNRNVDMARDLGYLQIPDDMLVDLHKIDDYPAHQITIMATGSQGEPSSVLSRMASGRHTLEVIPGDTIVVSAHPIPGNEELVYRTINSLYRRGAEVVYDTLEAVHVSGHGNQEDMRLMINLLKPRYFVPVHGELRHLKAHAQLAQGMGVPKERIFVGENGLVVEVDQRGVREGERVPGGYIFVDGSGVGDVGRAVLKDREILSRDGFVIVVANVDRKRKRLADEPEIISRGFVYLRDARELMDDMRGVVSSTVKSVNGASPRTLREKIEDGLSQMLYNETKRRPMVFAVINEV